MKLSEAILLGSTVLAPKAGTLHCAEQQAGCALGMAAVAAGCTFGRHSGAIEKHERSRSLGTAGVWGQWVLNEVARPCSCWFLMPRKMQVQEVITHIFDRHVVGKKKHWTLDELVEWVKTVEPVQPDIPAFSAQSSGHGEMKFVIEGTAMITFADEKFSELFSSEEATDQSK